MGINALLSTIILVAFIVTVVLAIGSYMAYKVRESRRPALAHVASEEPVFFERFYPTRGDAEPTAAAEASGEGAPGDSLA